MTRDLQRGDVPTLILAVLQQGSLHGYGIARAVAELSADALQLREGALYPALRALEDQGLVQSTWEVQPSGPARRVYALTTAGQTAALERVRHWQAYVNAVNGILQGGRKQHAK